MSTFADKLRRVHGYLLDQPCGCETAPWVVCHRCKALAGFTDPDVVGDLETSAAEVLRISDRKHLAWDQLRAALAKLEES